MPRQLLWNAAAAGLCVLVTTSAGFAQTNSYRQVSAAPSIQPRYQSGYRYQYSTPMALVGTYHSDDFFPSPLTLNITGMDRYGNLYGSIWGWRTTNVAGVVEPRWETWQHVWELSG